MLEERDRFLQHLHDNGCSRDHTRTVAAMLLNIVRILDLNPLRTVSVQEIHRATEKWLVDNSSRRTRPVGKYSDYTFRYAATRWLRFLGILEAPQVPLSPAQIIVRQFENFLREHNFSEEAVRSTTANLRRFLSWALERCGTLRAIRLEDVDRYLEMKKHQGCVPNTVIGICYALRSFFRYAEARDLNNQHVAQGIVNPKISRFDAPLGPPWRDVRRVLNCGFGDSPSELRAAAIFSLCSIYALRRGEVVNLKLDDFNWITETLTLRRSKSRRVQQFPLRFEVGERVLRYLQSSRPSCEWENVFVSVHRPCRPIHRCSTYAIVASRLRRFGIKADHFGTHSLRHSCATYLLNKGTPLQEIADFLGHSNMASVSIYAKHDLRSLRQVACFGLSGVK